MYTTFIEELVKIVNTQGETILSESRFGNIVRDTYSFGSDYALKKAFNDCVSQKFVERVLSKKSSKSATIKEIKTIVSSITNNKEEYLSVLFGIAISLNVCSIKDYQKAIRRQNASPIKNILDIVFLRDYIVGLSDWISSFMTFGNKSQVSNQKTPQISSTPPNTNRSSRAGRNRKWSFSLSEFGQFLRKYWGILLGVIIGILVLLFSTATLFSYMDNRLFGNILLVGTGELITLAVGKLFLNRCRRPETYIRMYSCWKPILIGYLLNALLPFFLISNEKANALDAFFTGAYIPDSYYAEPNSDMIRFMPIVGVWEVILSVVFVYFIFKEIDKLRDNFKSSRFQINKAWMSKCVIAIIMCYLLGFVVWPLDNRHLNKRMYEIRMKNNAKLIDERSKISKNVMVKGITIGESIEGGLVQLKKVSDNGVVKQEVDTIKICHPVMMLDAFLNLDYIGVYPYRKDKFHGFILPLLCRKYEVSTLLDNEQINLTAYVFDGQIQAISLTPAQGSIFSNATDMDKLYTSKYGKPEVLVDPSRKRSDIEYNKFLPMNRYYWHYKDVTILWTVSGIVYMSKSFADKITEQYSHQFQSFDKQWHLEEMRRQKAQHHRDSLERDSIIRDSLRREANHNNAKNEI